MPHCSDMPGEIMNITRTSKSVRKAKRQSPFEIPAVEWPDEKNLTELVAHIIAEKSAARNTHAAHDGELPVDYLKALVSIATNAWRAKLKMVDVRTGEIREEMRPVDRHIEAIYRNLAAVGIAIRDHTGDVYDEGQPMKVVASKPTLGLEGKRISETLLPSIFWKKRLIQNGEVEIATPARSDEAAGLDHP
jgi:hypothetical protein